MNHLENILLQVNEFLKIPEIAATIEKTTVKNDKYGLINNSFMFRENVSTNKNAKYIAISLDLLPVTKESCFITEGLELKSDFKIISRQDSKIKNIIPIESAISLEIKEMGDLVFILMGQIDDSIELFYEVEHKTYNQLVYKPQSPMDVVLEGSRLICKTLEDENALWAEIERQLHNLSTTTADIEILREKLGTPITKLKEQVYLNLIIPERFDTSKKYFLELISDSMRQQVESYNLALANLKSAASDRTQAMNEILRISYNFVEASDTMLRLIISVCDVKPILLWLTFINHIRLTESIRSLPWRKQDTKASMKIYSSTIKKARNKTFHSLIPFTKSFNVKLPENAIKDASLRIFSEFGSKSNRLEYRDKELVDILMEFTRTSEEVVSTAFWEKNISVIERACDVLDSTAMTLRALRA